MGFLAKCKEMKSLLEYMLKPCEYNEEICTKNLYSILFLSSLCTKSILCVLALLLCLFVFYVPSTARSFRDGTPIYCPLRRTWSSVNKPFSSGFESRAVAWQSITLPLRHASSTSSVVITNWSSANPNTLRHRLCDLMVINTQAQVCLNTLLSSLWKSQVFLASTSVCIEWYSYIYK